ncbi:glycoside hydrolase family 3 C-terminal domain-containing protein [Terriglobus sp.]|uniref:glycoside hydrolase family 3 C-terminal domain-containing protein n=1 Tax=Terriglobus sp. TaxID=1889013 RepID=UPI003B00C211
MTLRPIALALAAVAIALPAATQQSDVQQSGNVQQRPWLDTSLPAQQRAHLLVQKMTLDEKAQQLEDWATAIPRLGIPDYQTWNEALHGVARSGYATVFPQAIGMAATWNPKMLQQVGDVISTEARGKFNGAQREGNHRIFFGLTFWSPNINIFRDPRWGRGQETYGEDPFLTGQIAGGFIRGVQGPDPDHPKAVATSKHYAVHSGPESQRHIFDAVISNRDLEETYLPAFRSTVVDAHVKSLMCAYNAIDGHSACANTMLLKDHLRDAWHFSGFVVSDCAAIVDVTNGHHDAPDIEHAAAISLKAGTDLSCSIWAPGFNTLAKAVRHNLVSEDLVTQAAERLYTARFQLGLYDGGKNALDNVSPDVAGDAQNGAMAEKVAEASLVLLQNKGALPLTNRAKSIAVVGPTADLLVSLEGNYNGQARSYVTPLDGMLQLGGKTVHYAQGSTLADGVVVPVPRTALPGGLKMEVFASTDLSGQPALTRTVPNIQNDWDNVALAPGAGSSNGGHDYSVRWTGKLRLPGPGTYKLALEGLSSFPYSPKETFRFTMDGKTVKEGSLQNLRTAKEAAANSSARPEQKAEPQQSEPKSGEKPATTDATMQDAAAAMGDFHFAPGASPTAPPVMTGSSPAKFEVTVNDAADHDIVIEYSHAGDHSGGGLVLNWEPPTQPLLDEAVAAAKQSDIVVAFTGLSPQLEGEEMPVHVQGFSGGDRTSIDLPAAQQRMLEAVAATGKPVIVVNLSGSAIALNWAKEHAAAVVQAWYPGEAGGTAIARVLIGQSSPAGRLPVTFYASTGDLPAFTDYSMKNRTYRYYTGTPLWGFGYGLSYTTFQYGAPKLSDATLTAGKPLTVTVPVKNTGKVASDEVVEAYLKTPQPDGPARSLVAFERVHLNPGESRDVTLHVSDRSLSSVTDAGDHVVLPGHYELSVGSTQPGPGSNAVMAGFEVQGTATLPK